MRERERNWLNPSKRAERRKTRVKKLRETMMKDRISSSHFSQPFLFITIHLVLPSIDLTIFLSSLSNSSHSSSNLSNRGRCVIILFISWKKQTLSWKETNPFLKGGNKKGFPLWFKIFIPNLYFILLYLSIINSGFRWLDQQAQRGNTIAYVTRVQLGKQGKRQKLL